MKKDYTTGTVRNICVSKDSPRAYVIGQKEIINHKTGTVRNICVSKDSPRAYVIGDVITE